MTKNRIAARKAHEQDNQSDDTEIDDEEDEDEDFEVQSSSSGSDDDEDVDYDSPTDEIEESNTRLQEDNGRKWKKNDISSAMMTQLNTDDLSSDDDEEYNGNTIGRVPLHWYDAYDHIGYTLDGNKLVKRKGPDRVDLTIQNADAKGLKTVFDMYNNREVVLSERDLEIIRRIQMGAFAHPEHDDTPDYSDYFSSIKEVMPLSAAPEPKRRFIPSKWETMRVIKILKAIKEGRYKFSSERKQEEGDADSLVLWNEEVDDVIAESKRYKFHLPAPKMPLPGHAESYNPPPEYLLTEEESKRQEELDPSERPLNFDPKAHSCLRHVAGYENFVKERFERCLDLYLCPRKLKRRLNIDPETLIPRLPRPKELKPFPNSLCTVFAGHTGPVRTISISPDGQYFVSGGDDGAVRMWEVDSGFCRHVWQLGNGPVTAVVWNPSPDSHQHHLVAAAAGRAVFLIATGTADKDATEVVESQLAAVEKACVEADAAGADVEAPPQNDDGSDDDGDGDGDGDGGKDKEVKRKAAAKKGVVVRFHLCNRELNDLRHGAVVGPRVKMEFGHSVLSIVWHYKGDYLAVLEAGDHAEAVSIHQISKAKSQTPFSKSPGKVQAISFHPSRPFLFVATQQHIKVFHLVEQSLVKKLMSGCKWISSLDVHPSGDHVIVGSYDRRVVWFDLDLSSAPYKTLKFHEKAVRRIEFHKRYPLMASGSDDGNVHIFHSMVYSDLERNPLIVPLKVLKAHPSSMSGLGVFSIAFHPRQPWILTCGADGMINLFQDI